MRWLRTAHSGLRVERFVWIVLAFVAVVLLGLCVLSSVNFSSIVVAQRLIHVDVSARVTLQGINPNGTLAASGSLNLSVFVNFVNPSDRPVHLMEFQYCGWIEDFPAERGVNLSRLVTDDHLVDGAATHLYFPVVCLPESPVTLPVPARANISYPISFLFSRASNPSAFAALQNITAYGLLVLGSVDRVPWDHWVQVLFRIDDVPPATSPTAGSYILKIHLIVREVGVYLAS